MKKQNKQNKNISYNDKFVLKLKNKEIREKKKKLKEQIKLENKSKSELDKVMKLKPKDYRNVPDSKKRN